MTELDEAKQKIVKLEAEKAALHECWQMTLKEWEEGNGRIMAAMQIATIEAGEILMWAKEACNYLNGLRDSVSAESELDLRKLLQAAPKIVKDGAK